MKIKIENLKYGIFFKLILISLYLIVLYMPASTKEPVTYTSFKPGGEWLDNNGVHIDCHGCIIIYVDSIKTFYWYREHCGEPREVSCYSLKYLYNWKKEEVVIEKGDIAIFECPKVVYDELNDRNVMWFHNDDFLDVSNYSISELGVAVSDSPSGPFMVQNHYRPNGQESRDTGRYYEPDTKNAYLGYVADHVNRTIRMVELSEDYLSTTTNDVEIEEHCESPGILKKDGTFYLLTSQYSGWTHNPGTYHTATSVMGPYTIQGNPFFGDAGNNSFNSKACFIFNIPGYRNAWLYMGDRWNGGGIPNSEYVLLPITLSAEGKMEIHWRNEWDLSIFTPEKTER